MQLSSPIAIAPLVAAIVAISLPPIAIADNSDKTKLPSFAYEGCANDCQTKMDGEFTRCLQEQNSDDKYAQVKCVEEAKEKFTNCLEFCPVDAGRTRGGS